MITVNELFSGIGTQSLAFEYLGIPHKVVGMAEISEPAIKAYEVLHGPTRNYGDVSQIEKLDYADFWTYSFPCQDLSSGGKGRGMKEGTRSGLLWQVERLLEVAEKHGELPKFLLLENVPEINSKKHKPDFDKWLQKLDSLGYNNNYGVLRACDFGVPQLRERMFVISTRKDLNRDIIFANDLEYIPNPGFKDFVEPCVNEYSGPLMVDPTISPSVRANFERDLESISRATGFETNIYSCECTSGFQDNQVGIKFAPTIRHQNTHTAIFHNNQIHKLTAREAWRFMGIKWEDYDRVEKETGIGKTTMFGLAGNAIVVDVLMAIYKAMFIKGVDY